MKRKFYIILVAGLALLMSVASFAEVEHDGYILKFKDDNARKIAMEYIDDFGTLMGEDNLVSEIYEPVNLYKTQHEEIIPVLEKMGVLEYSEPDAICYLFDYNYYQDNMYSANQSTWSHAASNASGAWKYGVYGNGVKVAVIDSGVNPDHEDLVNSVVSGYSFVDTNGDGVLSESESANYVDSLGHGTGVAGVIAAAANGIGCVGIAHRAEIVAIKITNAGSFSTSVIAEAIYKAIELDVDVINLSLGTTAYLSTMNFAINMAKSKGIIVVAASGNISASFPAGEYVYPASFDGMISVGNIYKMSEGRYSIWSTSQHNDRVTIAAPGSSIITADDSNDHGYVYYTGTSFASPYVAGIAALAKCIKPDITHDGFKTVLINTADKSLLNGANYNNYYGYGVADAGGVVEAVIALEEKGGFVSPIDRTLSGDINVKIHNPGSSEATYSFFAKVQSADRPISFALRTVTLAAGGITEIPLAELAGADTSNVSCFLFEKDSLSPVYKKIED